VRSWQSRSPGHLEPGVPGAGACAGEPLTGRRGCGAVAGHELAEYGDLEREALSPCEGRAAEPVEGVGERRPAARVAGGRGATTRAGPEAARGVDDEAEVVRVAARRDLRDAGATALVLAGVREGLAQEVLRVAVAVRLPEQLVEREVVEVLLIAGRGAITTSLCRRYRQGGARVHVLSLAAAPVIGRVAAVMDEAPGEEPAAADVKL